jgi:CRP-like cAMP-binding protein
VVAEDAGERRVNQLTEGDYFGELLLLSGEPRTATVRALTPLELYTMSQADFTALLEREPSVRQVVAETAARWRAELLTQTPGARQPQETVVA